MIEEGGEELEEETWLEEMKPGMALFWQVQAYVVKIHLFSRGVEK